MARQTLQRLPPGFCRSVAVKTASHQMRPGEKVIHVSVQAARTSNIGGLSHDHKGQDPRLS